MGKNPTKTKNMIYAILALLLGVGLLTAGIYGVVSSRIASREYKNSTDIRRVTATVESYKTIAQKDQDGNTTDWDYEAKLSFIVDGKTYTGKETYYREISTGDEVTIEVYRTSKGEYKIRPEGNPVDFLLYCIAIPVGGFITVVMVNELFGKESNEKKNKEKAK